MPYLSKRKISPPSHKEENIERRSKKWSKYYGDKRWKALRQWQITNFPICHDCAIEGRSVPATEVHHVRPFGTGKTQDEKWNLLLDPDNIISLCAECHDKRHAQLKHLSNL